MIMSVPGAMLKLERHASTLPSLIFVYAALLASMLNAVYKSSKE